MDYNKYSLHVTKRCNMICSYCYESEDLRDVNITTEEFIRNIDTIMKDPNDKVEIEFIGGEPLLCFDRIKFACSYIHEIYPNKNVSYVITTNGTIYSDEIVELLIYYNILVCISLDGDAYSHNINRHFRGNNKGTHEVVFTNAVKYRNRLDMKNLVIHLTINKYTIGRIYSNVVYIFDKGFKKISLGFVHSDFSNGFMMMMEDELWRVTNYFAKIKNQDKELVLLPIMEEPIIHNLKSLSTRDGAVYLEELVTGPGVEGNIPDIRKKYYSILERCYKHYKLLIKED